MSESAARRETTVVSIARQPVFDENRKIWGHKLFSVGNAEGSVAIQLQSSAYACLRRIADQGKRMVVDFTEKSILENLPYALPPALAAVKVHENLSENPSAMDSLKRMKADGYCIVVSEFTGDSRCAALYNLADVICLEGTDEKETLSLMLTVAAGYKAAALAMRIPDKACFAKCQALGFSLFHGPFFKLPDRVTSRKLSSNEVVRFNLLKQMESADGDFSRLAETIQADATISLRLLAYLNSAAFALRQNVRSIQQAIALLGWRNVRNWLRVVLLSDMKGSRESHELVLISAQRGLLLERVGRDHSFWGFDPETLHLLGVFSLLDTLTGMPMADVVERLPLDNKLKAALRREPGNEYLPLLALAQCLEEARPAETLELIQKLNLDANKVKAAFQEAVDFSSELEALATE